MGSSIYIIILENFCERNGCWTDLFRFLNVIMLVMGSSVHTAFKSRFLNSDGIEYENFSERLNNFLYSFDNFSIFYVLKFHTPAAAINFVFHEFLNVFQV